MILTISNHNELQSLGMQQNPSPYLVASCLITPLNPYTPLLRPNPDSNLLVILLPENATHLGRAYGVRA